MRTPQAGKAPIIEQYKLNDRDTGSADVQVAVLTQRIRELTEHLKIHKKDKHTQRGLMKLVGKRTRLLRYLQRSERDRYQQLIAQLGIRGVRTNA